VCSSQNFFIQILDDLAAAAQVIGKEMRVAPESALRLGGFATTRVRAMELITTLTAAIASGVLYITSAPTKRASANSPNDALSSSLCGDFSFFFCTLLAYDRLNWQSRFLSLFTRSKNMAKKKSASSRQEKRVPANVVFTTPLGDKERRELQKLATMEDSQIDYSDAPETQAGPPETHIGCFYRPIK
jgi:hypothetical protein